LYESGDEEGKLLTLLGWRFLSANEHKHRELCGPDPLHDDVAEIRDLYFKANPDYTGRYSVPILWDKKTETIVNNESAEIVQMFNSAFNSLVDDKYMTVDLYPSQSKEDIDAFNSWIYNDINNGV
jgi:glutathionyl-hydroquinone reductase